MKRPHENPSDRLWVEYSQAFKTFDDLTLARWMSQTLGQLEGRAWRLSHPLVATYRLAASVGHEREIWHKRLVTIPSSYTEAPCCRSPLLVLFNSEILESGLRCHHCGGTAVPLEDIPAPLRRTIINWAAPYALNHEIAHWSDEDQPDNYDEILDEAAEKAKDCLVDAGQILMPKLLNFLPTLTWEDQDYCLDVQPEDIDLRS